MKNRLLASILISFLNLSLPTLVWAKDYIYRIERGDTYGNILLSIGHENVWSDKTLINTFLHKDPKVDKIKNLHVGKVLHIPLEMIKFRKNVRASQGRIQIIRKISKLSEFRELAEQEKIEIKTEYRSLKTLYMGAGGFYANNTYQFEDTKSVTKSGLQPVIQAKFIWSHEAFGSLAFDIFAKKIFNNQFSFPLNIDGRIQFLPKYNLPGDFKLALSHSFLKHSYAVGEESSKGSVQKLNGRFIGLGVVVPKDNFWYEFYFEKMYAGTNESKLGNISVKDGWRIDSELVYPIFDKWKFIPGVNYFQFDNSAKKANLNVWELRMVFAREIFL